MFPEWQAPNCALPARKWLLDLEYIKLRMAVAGECFVLASCTPFLLVQKRLLALRPPDCSEAPRPLTQAFMVAMITSPACLSELEGRKFPDGLRLYLQCRKDWKSDLGAEH
jgi:hypothetical protein